MLSIIINAQPQSAYNPQLLAQAKQDAAEVYKNCSQYAGDEYIPTYASWLSRVEIQARPLSEGANYALLSSVLLKNKCNGALERDTPKTFNPETFNPLKYFFEFHSDQDKIYRVDGTNYIIIIHAATK
jgi:hypothetical protein